VVIYKYNFRLPEHKTIVGTGNRSDTSDPPDYCYRVRAWGEFSIAMPEHAKVLGMQEHRQELVVWAMIDPTAPKTNRRFFYVGTGQHIPLSYVGHLSHISTIPLVGGAMFHFFELDGGVPVETN